MSQKSLKNDKSSLLIKNHYLRLNTWTIQPTTSPIMINAWGLTATYMITIPNTAKATNVRASVVISLNISNMLASYRDRHVMLTL